MKKLKWIAAGLLFLAMAIKAAVSPQGFPSSATLAQTEPISLSASDLRTLPSLSNEQLSALLDTLDAVPQISANFLPQSGTFWSLANPSWPPLPVNVNGLSVWQMSGGSFLLNDLNVDYAAPLVQTRMAMRAIGLDTPSFDETGGGSGLDTNVWTFTFDTNTLWLEITNVTSTQAYANLHNATNFIYEIWSKTDLTASNWLIETEVLGQTNPLVIPFTVPTLARTNLFLWARDWTGVDENTNGLPDWWEWKYFGGFNQTSTNDYDSDGVSNVQEFTNHTDPNKIRFALQFTNHYFNAGPARGAISLLGGAPSSVALVVNSTNFTMASWQPYSSNLVVSLGAGEGDYDVWVGLRGLPADAQASWQWIKLTLDTTAPVLTVTDPTGGTVSSPLTQLQGLVNESLSRLTYDVSNASGIITNQPGYWNPVFYNTNLYQFTTNFFQGYDVKLTNGLNTVTLHAVDLAGNATNFNVNLTYVPGTNAPVLNLAWPTNGTLVSGGNFVVRAHVNDATASITASVNGNAVQGLVERSGQVWLSNLPLNAGTNAVTVITTDANGNRSTNNFNVVRNDVGLVVGALPSYQLNLPSVTVRGSIGDATDTVTVNGVTATMYEDGTWQADNVPVDASGTATLLVNVYDANGNLIASQLVAQPQPAKAALMSYTKRYHSNSKYWGQNDVLEYGEAYLTADWLYPSGGISHSSGFSFFCATCADNNSWNTSTVLPAGENGFSPSWQYADFIDNDSGDHSTETVQNKTQTRVMLKPAGMTAGDATKLYLIRAKALETVPEEVQFWEGESLPLPPEWLQIQDQTLANSGLTNEADGAVWGETVIAVPAGTTPDVTPTATQVHELWDYTFDVKVEEITLSLDWTNKADNFSIEDNNNPITGEPMPGGGKRIFVGAKTPSEGDARNTVLLKARLSVPVPNIRISFRAFDVDDPTPTQFDADSVIDPNGAAGNDNFGYQGTDGIFTSTVVRDTYAYTDTNGEATVEFQVGLQPGNNYRVAATFFNSSKLDKLNVDNPTADGFVPANDSQVINFGGVISPMLTVWRKLHVEVDSMAAVPTSGSQANFQTGTISGYQANVPTTGQSTIHMSTRTDFAGVDDQCENGRLEINGFAPLKVISNTYATLETFVVDGTPGTNIIGQTFKIYDDDDRFLSTLGLPPALPKDDESTNIIEGLRAVFFPAYIDVTNANAEGLNPNKEIPFALNAYPAGVGLISIFDDAKDLNDSSLFWAHTLVFGYQPDIDEDGDPNAESGGDPLLGGTPKSLFGTSQGYSVIYVESIRDKLFRTYPDSTFTNSIAQPVLQTLLINEIMGVIVHEIGHSPGGHYGGTDHTEGGLMITGAASIENNVFTPATVKRFRNAERWKE